MFVCLFVHLATQNTSTKIKMKIHKKKVRVKEPRENKKLPRITHKSQRLISNGVLRERRKEIEDKQKGKLKGRSSDIQSLEYIQNNTDIYMQ